MKEKLISLNLRGHEADAEEEKTPAVADRENAEGGITSKGEARYQAISTSIGNAGRKVFGWMKRGGELFKAGAVGALSTPEVAVAGAKFVGTKIEEGAEFVGEKAKQTGEWAGGTAKSVYEFSSQQAENAKNFVGTKAEQMGGYVKDKALLVEAVGSLVKEKTTEQLGKAKDGVVGAYGKTVEYGKGAVDSASLRCQQVKDGFNKKKNAFMEATLLRRAEIQSERLQATMAKLAQYRQVEQLGSQLSS